jgi:uncharacterized protein (UPF0261 family)
MDAAVEALGDRGDVVRLEAYINDPVCAETAVAQLIRRFRSPAVQAGQTA